MRRSLDKAIQMARQIAKVQLAPLFRVASEMCMADLRTRLETERVFVLSTCHMPESVPDFGAIRVAAHEYGYVVFLTTGEDRDAPAWLAPVVALAKENMCTYINFDRDAPVVPELCQWEW